MMVCAPHLSFLEVILSFVILCIVLPSMGCGGECRFCALLKFICCASWGFIWDVGGCVGRGIILELVVVMP